MSILYIFRFGLSQGNCIMKYTYLYVLKANYGYGWEDLEELNKHETHYIVEDGIHVSAWGYAKYLLRENLMVYPNAHYKIISRRELNK